LAHHSRRIIASLPLLSYAVTTSLHLRSTGESAP
jgi:hypothetical protein